MFDWTRLAVFSSHTNTDSITSWRPPGPEPHADTAFCEVKCVAFYYRERHASPTMLMVWGYVYLFRLPILGACCCVLNTVKSTLAREFGVSK